MRPPRQFGSRLHTNGVKFRELTERVVGVVGNGAVGVLDARHVAALVAGERVV